VGISALTSLLPLPLAREATNTTAPGLDDLVPLLTRRVARSALECPRCLHCVPSQQAHGSVWCGGSWWAHMHAYPRVAKLWGGICDHQRPCRLRASRAISRVTARWEACRSDRDTTASCTRLRRGESVCPSTAVGRMKGRGGEPY
jgi:hypothetical protein